MSEQRLEQATGVRRRILLAWTAAVVIAATSALAFTAPPPALAAGDANEASCPAATEASPGFRSYLPDCRAYELANPSFTAGFALTGPGLAVSKLLVAKGSQRLIAQAFGTFAGTESGVGEGTVLGASYLLTRTQDGWQPEAITPSASSRFPFAEFVDAGAELDRTLWDLNESVTETGEALFYIRESNGSLVPVGPKSRIAATEMNKDGETTPVYTGASGDLVRITFELGAPAVPGQVEGQSSLWPGDTTIANEGGTRRSLYEYDGTGNSEPKLVAVNNQEALRSNSEAQMIGECGSEIGSGGTTTKAPAADSYNAVSANGYAVFFTVAPGPCQAKASVEDATKEVELEGKGPKVAELYARVNGERTVKISEPPLSGEDAVPGRECTGVCAEDESEESKRSPGWFAGASEDGEKVFFITDQPLVNADKDSTADLYMAELSGSHITRLVDVSEGAASDTTRGSGAEVQGVVRVAENGERVYFVAEGVLTTEANANGEAAAAKDDNLYVYDAATGATAFVARLASTDDADWGTDVREVQASSPGGRFLVFSSDAHLEGTRDTSGSGTNVPQLFEYDAQTESVVRVSIGQKGSYPCPQKNEEKEEGYNCDGNLAYVTTKGAPGYPVPKPEIGEQEYNAERGSADAPYQKLAITNAGTVFFDSADALTPQAQNGYPNLSPAGLANVYEYRAGNVYLISDGQETKVSEKTKDKPLDATELIGSAVEGEQLLFTSRDVLVPQDLAGTQVEVYDAQVDGGFPAPSARTECEGEASCHGASAGEPGSVTLPSTTAPAGENLTPTPKVSKPKPEKPKKKKTKKKKHKRKTKAKKKHKPKAKKKHKRDNRASAKRAHRGDSVGKGRR